MAKSSTVTSTSAVAAKPRSTSRPLKGTDSKVHDGAMTTDTAASGGVASGGSSSDEGKTKHKKDRSQSRKRGGLFGAFLGKKEEHDEKKEVKKEEKAEEKALKQETKKEEKIEKEEIKAEKKLEKDEAKDGVVGGSAPLDPVAVGTVISSSSIETLLICVASRVLAEPVIPAAGTKAVAAEETPRPVTSEPAVITSTAEAAPKPVKRNSLFGNLWAKKDSGATSSKDAVPTLPTKEPETTPVSATAPRIEEPVHSTSTESATAAPAPTPVADVTEPASPVVATPPAASPSTDKRRSSFFNSLGGKREKKAEGSDVDAVDGEGRKSNAGKFTGLFRKPSRATPPAQKEASPTTGPPPTVAEGEPLATAPGPALVDQKSPVAASA